MTFFAFGVPHFSFKTPRRCKSTKPKAFPQLAEVAQQQVLPGLPQSSGEVTFLPTRSQGLTIERAAEQ
jgi:hypothetical protein